MEQKETRGLHTSGASEPEAAVHFCGQEVGAVALLLSPHTSSRALRPVHEAWAAALHMVQEVLQHLVQLAVAATTEECYP